MCRQDFCAVVNDFSSYSPGCWSQDDAVFIIIAGHCVCRALLLEPEFGGEGRCFDACVVVSFAVSKLTFLEPRHIRSSSSLSREVAFLLQLDIASEGSMVGRRKPI